MVVAVDARSACSVEGIVKARVTLECCLGAATNQTYITGEVVVRTLASLVCEANRAVCAKTI